MKLSAWLVRFKKSLQTKWSLWKFAGPAFCNGASSSLCYAIGWHYSTVASTTPLTRAGAAATIFAIMFTLYDFREKLRESEKTAYKTFKSITDKFQYTGDASLKAVAKKLQAKTSRADLVINAIQSGILISATFMWGFGDFVSVWILAISHFLRN